MTYIKSLSKINEINYAVVSTTLEFADFLGAVKARWAVNRNQYNVKPGLYAVGNPDESSDVFVSANYKLSFDALRKNLSDINAWILVLDTKGINVWCAAGKGTFGTNEIISKIRQTELEKIVSIKRLIVPQLGAPGVSAHEVKKQTGFSVIYGPVRADDLKKFISNNYKADETMRTMVFPAYQRLKLTPVEIVGSIKQLLLILAAFFLVSGFSATGYSIDTIWSQSFKTILNIFIAYLGGTVITPVLLPWITFRSFSFKGIVVGLLLSVLLFILKLSGNNLIEIIGLAFINMAITSYVAMNFTGCTTYTSLSGVLKEMKIALPLQITIASIGVVCWITARFLSYNISL